MVRISNLFVFFILVSLGLQAQPKAAKTEIMLLGSTHFAQEGFYKNAPLADLFLERRQQELTVLRTQLARFNPDLILIEREAKEQPIVDSLYRLYRAGKLDLKAMADGRGRAEEFQIAYALGKQLNHNRIVGVNFYSGTSNRILDKGQGIAYYQDELKTFAELGRSLNNSFSEGRTTVVDYLSFINSPEVLEQAYHVLFVTPAKVRNAHLNTTDSALDSTRISSEYVGADFITHFYNRELRIYSNIVATQLAQKKGRILVVMGQRHAAGLKKIFENDPDYKLIPVADYLK